MYKLKKHVTEEMLKSVGFAYRRHYDNFIYSVMQPRSEETIQKLYDKGFSYDEALKTDELKATYLDYFIQIDLNTKKIDIFTHALKDFPYEQQLHQHEIAHEIISKIVEMVKKGFVEEV